MSEYKYHSFIGLNQNNIRPKAVPFKCDKCEFIGKNQKSINFHRIKKHASKHNNLVSKT